MIGKSIRVLFFETFSTFECRDFLSNGSREFLSEVFLENSKSDTIKQFYFVHINYQNPSPLVRFFL